MRRRMHRITYGDRQIMEQMLKDGCSMASIAEKIGVNRVSVYKELYRAGCSQEEYNAELAQRKVVR